ncbi:MAG: glucose-1-phosphate adenylyltransferase, partial [Oscillospiraceae bacterium]|nr:glucose-1-phosphate adenylyltransferase [Oscillospiraceae bacterium]
VIFGGVTIEEGAKVLYSVVMPGTVIKAGAVVEYAIVGEDCVIGENAHVGRDPSEYAGEARDNWGIAVTGHRITIGAGKEVAPKQILSESI